MSDDTAPELSPIQQKALEQGWKPKEQFEGDPDEFIDAPEFVRRGELFSKIEHQGKELKTLRQGMEAMKAHHAKVADFEYKRALKTLQEERKQALLNQDVEKALKLEEDIEETKAEQARNARDSQVPTVPEVNPEFVQWTDKNKWYTSDKAMRAVADRIGLELHGQGMAPSDVLKRVEQEVKEAFPHKFANPKRSAPSPVEGSSRAGNTVQRKTVVLDDDERAVMKKIVRSGVMTEEQYMAEYQKMKG